MDDLVAKLRQTFHGHAAEAAAKQQPAATVREAIPEAVAPAAQSLRADAPGTARGPAPDMDDDLLREGLDTQTLYMGGGHQGCQMDALERNALLSKNTAPGSDMQIRCKMCACCKGRGLTVQAVYCKEKPAVVGSLQSCSCMRHTQPDLGLSTIARVHAICHNAATVSFYCDIVALILYHLAGPRNPGPRTGGIPPVPSIGTDDLHPPMPGIPREFPGPDNIPYPGGVPSPLLESN